MSSRYSIDFPVSSQMTELTRNSGGKEESRCEQIIFVRSGAVARAAMVAPLNAD
jgi:hypothetical protein